MKILIYGDRGLIGSELRRRLSKDKRFELAPIKHLRWYDGASNYDLFGCRAKLKNEVDVTSKGILYTIKNRWGSDFVIINCAGIEGKERCDNNMEEAFNTNLGGVSNLIDFVRNSDVKLIHFSTTEMHRPHGFANSSRNEAIKEDSLIWPKSYYAKTNVIADKLIKASLPKEKYMILKPGLTYGQFPDDNYSLITKIIERIFLQEYQKVEFKEKLYIPINPLYQKDYLAVEHLVSMIMHILEFPDNCWGKEMFLSKNDSRPFVNYLNIIRTVMKVGNIENYINFDSENDILGKHSVISNKFNKIFPGYRINKAAMDDASSINYVYKSVMEYYTDNYMEKLKQ